MPSTAAVLRALCLAAMGLTALPALATPVPEAPPPYRCQPEPPFVQVMLGEVESVRTPSELTAVVMAPDGSWWAVGPGGRAWHRTLDGAWERQAPLRRVDLVSAAFGRQLWAIDTGSVWALREGAWVRAKPPVEGELRHVVAWDRIVAVAGEERVWISVDDGESWKVLDAGGTISALSLSGARLILARADGVLRRLDGTPEGWKAIDTPLPPDLRIAEIGAVGDAMFAASADGEFWASADLGQTWASDEEEHDDDPVRGIERTPFGWATVHESGRVRGIMVNAPQPALYALFGMRLSAPMPGMTHSRGASSVLSLRADGTLMAQSVQLRMGGGRPCGRPFEIGGSSIMAGTAGGAGWTMAVGACPELSGEVRAALAAAWLRDARAEHASIASFARFVLRLMALGAPADLVEDAQRAMADEIRHARTCFTLAGRYAGEDLEPGPLPVRGALDGPSDLASVAVEVLREGAVGESIGAMLAASMRQGATDADVCDVLDEIAHDEAEHARAAWRFLAWAVAEGGEEVKRALDEALEDAIGAALLEPVAATPVGPAWAAHGRLCAAEERRVVRRAIDEVVRPCAAALASVGAPAGSEREVGPVGDDAVHAGLA